MKKIECCKECTKRYLGCHSECEEYISESNELKNIKHNERREHYLMTSRNNQMKSRPRNKWSNYRKDNSRRK